MRFLLIPVLLLAAGCGYDPPVQGDRASAGFQRSLKACRTGAERAQAQREGTPGAMIGALFDGPGAERHEVTACMQARGYAAR